MNGIGGWFRRLGAGIRAGIQRFMTGRYGTDKLNLTILAVGVALCLLSVLIPPAALVLTVISYGLLGWAIFRSLSRNTYKRYQENRKYLMLIDRIKDRQHRYYECPR